MALSNPSGFIRQALIVAFGFSAVTLPAAEPETAHMPQPTDYASMWWAEGFPEVVPGAPWHRVIQTGHYAFVLDTKSLAVPHFGPIPLGDSFKLARHCDDRVWKKLPGAQLELQIQVNGKSFRCTGSNGWSKHGGPRLIDSGRFFQRGDVTDLIFETADGERLNTEARFETAAWPDRLGLVLDAQPGDEAIQPGDDSFGKFGGGYGLDGRHFLTVPHSPEIDAPEFTIEFWAFVPPDYRVSEKVSPWLVCKNRNEAHDGNFGIMIVNGLAQARMNIGGGKDGQIVAGTHRIRQNAWNHFALSYDGNTLLFLLNAHVSAETKVGKARKPGSHDLAFGRREDNFGDGYPFRGVVDEIRIYNRALTIPQLRQRYHNPQDERQPIWSNSFREDGKASETRPKIAWNHPKLSLTFSSGKKTFQQAGRRQPCRACDSAHFYGSHRADQPGQGLCWRSAGGFRHRSRLASYQHRRDRACRSRQRHRQ